MTTPPPASTPPGPTPPPRQTTAWAIAALIFGIIGAALLGIGCAVVALMKIRGGRFSGRGMAVAGLIVSGVWIVVGTAAAVVLFTGDDSADVAYVPAVGTCFSTGTDDSLVRSNVVSCDNPHRTEVVAVLPVPGDTYPGDDNLDKVGSRCEGEFVKYAAADAGSADVKSMQPTEEGWAHGSRTVKCVAVTDEPMTGSFRG